MEAIRAIVAKQQSESSALSVRGEEQRLSSAEHEHLMTLCEQMQAYFPHQEFADETVKGYLFDFERLVLKFGMTAIETALLELRIEAGRKFFPHPTEVAEKVERELDAERSMRSYRETKQRLAEYERQFWVWVASRMQDEDTRGMTLQQFLDTVTQVGYTGRKESEMPDDLRAM
jgi:hypothetical protein